VFVARAIGAPSVPEGPDPSRVRGDRRLASGVKKMASPVKPDGRRRRSKDQVKWGRRLPWGDLRGAHGRRSGWFPSSGRGGGRSFPHRRRAR